jgi:hypothetical protein
MIWELRNGNAPTLPHFMPLSTQVLTILRELHSLTGAKVALSVS